MLDISTHKRTVRQNENNMQLSAFIAKLKSLQPSRYESPVLFHLHVEVHEANSIHI